MKLVRYGDVGAEKPGMIDANGDLRDLSAHVADINGDVLANGLEKLRALDPSSLPGVEGSPRMGPCVGDIGKFMCIGLNYADHAAESGLPLPDHPILFMKANSAIIGPNDTVMIPRTSTQTDWEVELGVVIGKTCKYVSKADALDYVAGYCIVNDVSEREFQQNLTGQWTKGKSADSFGPVGPWLVTRDEVPDPQNLTLSLWHNGEQRQNGTTSKMIFSVAKIVSYLSEFMSLQPGDVIATGSPPGVGMGHRPQIFLRPGDVIEAEVEGLGRQCQLVKADN